MALVSYLSPSIRLKHPRLNTASQNGRDSHFRTTMYLVKNQQQNLIIYQQLSEESAQHTSQIYHLLLLEARF